METREPVGGQGDEALRVGGAQVGVCGERQPAHVGKRPELGGFQAARGELLLVKGDVPGDAAHDGLQPMKLQLFQCRSRQRFNFPVPERIHHVSLFC